MLLYIFNLSNFPRSATLHILLFGKLMCVCVYTDNWFQQAFILSQALSDSDGGGDGAQRADFVLQDPMV